MRIPLSTDEITPEWLTEALRVGGYLDEGRVESVEFERIGVGLGFVSLVVRGTVQYSGPHNNAPQTLVAKLLSGHPETDALVKSLGAGHREVCFFNELAPDLGVPIPDNYYADSNEETGDFILLLEDLSGARLGDELNGVSQEDAELVVTNLARMHAKWWNSDRLGQLDWVTNIADPETAARFGNAYRSAWERIASEVISRFPDAMEELAVRFGTHYEEVMRPLGESPTTLNHGDGRPGNLFFRNDNGTTEVVRIDWQAPSFSRGATDLAYFIVFGLPLNERRARENALLQLYHRVLNDNGVDDYPYERLVEDYRRGLFRYLFIVVLAFGNVDFDSDGGRAIVDAVIPRLAVLTDWDCGELIPE